MHVLWIPDESLISVDLVINRPPFLVYLECFLDLSNLSYEDNQYFKAYEFDHFAVGEDGRQSRHFRIRSGWFRDFVGCCRAYQRNTLNFCIVYYSAPCLCAILGCFDLMAIVLFCLFLFVCKRKRQILFC